MWSKRSDPRYWISAWLPVAVGIGVIMIESTEWMGSNYTAGPLRWLYESIFGPVADARWELLHHFIRKSGHFLGYGAMGLLWLRAWWMSLPRSRFLHDALLALLGTALVASADEWHQTFMPNRTGSPWDVLLDCCGAITLEVLVYVFMRMFRPKKLERAA
ncbi:MAG: VanZ family protein [Terracidiphilus sp.]|jgi:VanZ family protein